MGFRKMRNEKKWERKYGIIGHFFPFFPLFSPFFPHFFPIRSHFFPFFPFPFSEKKGKKRKKRKKWKKRKKRKKNGKKMGKKYEKRGCDSKKKNVFFPISPPH